MGAKLKIGTDVPWVTSWTAEAVLGVAPCPTVNGQPAVWQQERPGVGKPQYSKNHLQRQRASIRGLLCPLCGAPKAEGDRWTLTGRWTTAGALRADGRALAVPFDLPDARPVLSAGAIAPGHKACMERSHRLCPHLAAMAGAALLAFPRRWYVSVIRGDVIAEAPAPAPAAALTRPAAGPPAPVAFLQLCGLGD